MQNSTPRSKPATVKTRFIIPKKMRKEALSMLTAGKQSNKDTQIRTGEQPSFRLPPGRSGCADDGAKMFAAGHGAKMLDAYSRQAGNFVLSEKLLSRFNSDHPQPSFTLVKTDLHHHNRNSRHHTEYFPSNSPAVYLLARFLPALDLQTFRFKRFRGVLTGRKSNWRAPRKSRN
jgi:hypothetical protein